MPEEVQPAKRGPGRPRKTPALDVEDTVEPIAEVPVPQHALWIDERVGQRVDNPAWVGFTFEDDREYRVANGVIVERVR